MHDDHDELITYSLASSGLELINFKKKGGLLCEQIRYLLYVLLPVFKRC